MITVIIYLCNIIWDSRESPSDWTQSLIIDLHKKDKINNYENYRTISLISHTSQIMVTIILRTMQPIIEELMSEERPGFRS